jgi:hypothetical protein
MAGGGDNVYGPNDLVEALLARRRDTPTEDCPFGNISPDGVRRLIRTAYHGSQAPNEGRFPRFTLLVPAADERVDVLVPLRDELTVRVLQRLGPAVAPQDQALVVRERDKSLYLEGITALKGPLTELVLGDPTLGPIVQPHPKGLLVEVSGPGEIRAGEHRTLRLQAGSLRQERSFAYERWFGEWYLEAAGTLFGWTPKAGADESGWSIRPDFAIVNVWQRLLRRAAELRRGGCFVILPEAGKALIRPAFRAAGCDLGAILADCCKALRYTNLVRSSPLTAHNFRLRVALRERLLSAVDVMARLSATDGCVVFNRKLQLHSFGTMIEVPEGRGEWVPIYEADSSTALAEGKLRSYGARHRSAVQLCRACPGTLAFVISQDGDLRAFVHRNDCVRVYDNLDYW